MRRVLGAAAESRSVLQRRSALAKGAAKHFGVADLELHCNGRDDLFSSSTLQGSRDALKDRVDSLDCFDVERTVGLDDERNEDVPVVLLYIRLVLRCFVLCAGIGCG